MEIDRMLDILIRTTPVYSSWIIVIETSLMNMSTENGERCCS